MANLNGVDIPYIKRALDLAHSSADQSLIGLAESELQTLIDTALTVTSSVFRDTVGGLSVWYVDAIAGSDTNPGYMSAPMQSLSVAFSTIPTTELAVVKVRNISSIVLSNVRRLGRIHILPWDLANPETLTTVTLNGCTSVHVRGFNIPSANIQIGSSGGSVSKRCIDCVIAGNIIGPKSDAIVTGIYLSKQPVRCAVVGNEIKDLTAPAGWTGSTASRGIFVQGTTGAGVAGTREWDQRDIYIENNYIHGVSADAIGVYGISNKVRIRDNFITGNQKPAGTGDHADGIQCGGGFDLDISNNVIWDTQAVGAGILVKDWANAMKLRLLRNTVANTYDSSGSSSPASGNGISISNCPGAEIIDNFVWETRGPATPLNADGGGLSIYSDTTSSGAGIATEDGNTGVPSTGLILVRNTLDKLRLDPLGTVPVASIREQNWVNNENGNGNLGWVNGDDYNVALQDATIDSSLLTNRITSPFGRWQRDPFAYWHGVPR